MNNKGIPIFLSSDNNYAPFVATTIASICDNTESYCDFYILDGGITEENKEKICELKRQFSNFSIEFINIEEYITKFHTTTLYKSKTMFARLFIPNIKIDIDKAIYSDVDVIFLDDIMKYYNEPLDDYIIGCIQAPFTRTNIKNTLNFSSKHVYFCSGNLLINCNKWRKENIQNKILETYYKYKDVLLFPDQDVLNKIFDNNYKVLDKKYCVTEFHMEYYNNIDKIFIRHFGTSIKPWQINPFNNYNYPNINAFWKYAKITPFYEDLLNNTKDEEKQKEIYRKLQVNKLIIKLLVKQSEHNTRRKITK